MKLRILFWTLCLVTTFCCHADDLPLDTAGVTTSADSTFFSTALHATGSGIKKTAQFTADVIKPFTPVIVVAGGASIIGIIAWQRWTNAGLKKEITTLRGDVAGLRTLVEGVQQTQQQHSQQLTGLQTTLGEHGQQLGDIQMTQNQHGGLFAALQGDITRLHGLASAHQRDLAELSASVERGHQANARRFDELEAQHTARFNTIDGSLARILANQHANHQEQRRGLATVLNYSDVRGNNS